MLVYSPLHRRRRTAFSPPARLLSLLIAVRFANLVDPGSGGGLAGCCMHVLVDCGRPKAQREAESTKFGWSLFSSLGALLASAVPHVNLKLRLSDGAGADSRGLAPLNSKVTHMNWEPSLSTSPKMTGGMEGVRDALPAYIQTGRQR